ncbi:MAG: bestrophin family ion channel [Bacteroidota bacterium]
MINYNSKNWVESVRHFKTSYVIRRTVRMCIWMGVYAGGIYLLDYISNEYGDILPYKIDIIQIDTSIFGLLGIFLSLLLVFRTNTAYDRWWEGRKQWGALINHTRGLALIWHGMLGKNDIANRTFFARAIGGYSLALSDHLRDHANHEWIYPYSDEPKERVDTFEHVPNKIARDMYQRTEELYKDGFIDGFQLTQVRPEIQEFLNIQGACERIKATPIPFAHNFFIKMLILVYTAFLPFVLVPTIGFYAIIMTMLVSYALVGLEYISVEIEEPFGLDCNDLPTHNLARKIEKNVHEILEIELIQDDKEVKKQYLVIS